MSWPIVVRLGAVGRDGATHAFEADAQARAQIVRDLDLASMDHFSGAVSIAPWYDGAEIRGRFHAKLAQICGITAEPLPVELDGAFSVRVVPPESPHAPSPSTEIDIDPDADEPPDVLEGEEIDLTAYAVEHLALELDPFPRKPGAVFVQPDQTPEPSPFAVLKDFKPRKDGR